MLFHPLVVLKASNLKDLWLFKHTPMMGKMEDFFPRNNLGWSSSALVCFRIDSNFFSIWSLLSLEKYVRQKYSLCLFSKKNFEFVCFPPFYHLFSKKWAFFAKNYVYWWETDKLEIFFFNEKFECFRCFFIRWLYYFSFFFIIFVSNILSHSTNYVLPFWGNQSTFSST